MFSNHQNTPDSSSDRRRFLISLVASLWVSTVQASVDTILGCPKMPPKDLSPEEIKKRNTLYQKIRSAQEKEPIPNGMKWEKRRHEGELRAVRTHTTPRAMTFSDTQKLREKWKLITVRPELGNLNIDSSLGDLICVSLEQKELLRLLAPHAANILYFLGNAFYKKFSKKLKITSLNRNHEYVKWLQKSNANAANESSHEYGTTFDISYFQSYSGNNDFFIPLEQRQFLENILGILQKAGAIHITKEKYKSCYHVCCIPNSSLQFKGR